MAHVKREKRESDGSAIPIVRHFVLLLFWVKHTHTQSKQQRVFIKISNYAEYII